jgi:hypothetical protein
MVLDDWINQSTCPANNFSPVFPETSWGKIVEKVKNNVVTPKVSQKKKKKSDRRKTDKSI